ncbi:hypothetical protein AVEN_38376-1 [Araneus ventricosus]|uniref:Uncharacterized protein n=1 Tax=Araneus ventricosus TaxID=182803 RepID=A0A4Y2HDK8_ARAVE|nr:hypothetical protein AVEN_64625-1 [Araneus ventricosus]GBN22417.1 hypothetical protein AVEN_38376-1 [Araneus ventricosus]
MSPASWAGIRLIKCPVCMRTHRCEHAIMDAFIKNGLGSAAETGTLDWSDGQKEIKRNSCKCFPNAVYSFLVKRENLEE